MQASRPPCMGSVYNSGFLDGVVGIIWTRSFVQPQRSSVFEWAGVAGNLRAGRKRRRQGLVWKTFPRETCTIT